MVCKLNNKALSGIVLGLMFGLVIVLEGCGAGRKTAQTTSDIKPPVKQDVIHVVKSTPRDNKGSLWRHDGPLSDLFINPKARKVGDIVTIRIVESSKASNMATTSTSRDSSLTAGLENFFNAEKRYPSSQPFINPFSATAIKGGLKSSFGGEGTTKRSGDLTAYITARIAEVLPNGNLVIVGTREVKVNNEVQLISLTGIVRPRDISSENIILSTYISDARIAYSGTGVINDRQRPGWLTRILNAAWPF